jgi:hypothetical protein
VKSPAAAGHLHRIVPHLENFFVVEWDIDLLGDPVPPGRGKRGRTGHIPTVENRRKVMVLAAFDRCEADIAAAVGISEPTLRKHYFRELAARREARARLDAKLIMALLAKVEKGDTGAIDKFFKRLDRHDLITGRVMAPPTKSARPAQPARKGKKEQLADDARAGSTSGEWGSLLN